VLEDPVGASLRSIQTLNGTVAGRFDPIFEIKVDHGHYPSNIDRWEIADAASIVGRGLELGELVLGDSSLADGVSL